jgi:hypothetical protein
MEGILRSIGVLSLLFSMKRLFVEIGALAPLSHSKKHPRACFVTLTAIFGLLASAPANAQNASYALGTSDVVEGPAAGSDSVILTATSTNAAWMATANSFWLHLSAGNQSGAGSTNVIFSFDTNLGATRSGTLTIAGHKLTVTQASSNYVSASPITLVSNMQYAYGPAVDSAGNVYWILRGS